MYLKFHEVLSAAIILALVTEMYTQKCDPVKIGNGYSRDRGKVTYFYCNKGYRRFGNSRATCRPSGWSKPPPICHASGCTKFIVLENGNIKTIGTSLMFLSCHKGFLLMGYNAMYCNGTSWSSAFPKCKVPALIDYCDFEYDTLCGWRQDGKDDFDWTWHYGSTSTGWTGPDFDHTYQSQNPNGHYLYLEMSVPRMIGHTARLISPVYDASKSDVCFQMWYHMLGPDGMGEVGTLRMIMKKTTTGENTTLFMINGNQGNIWHLADVYIEKTTEDFEIIIEGTREKSYVSDIAIDDLRFYNCTAPTIGTTTSGTENYESTDGTESFTDITNVSYSEISEMSNTTATLKSNFSTNTLFYTKADLKGEAISVPPVKSTTINLNDTNLDFPNAEFRTETVQRNVWPSTTQLDSVTSDTNLKTQDEQKTTSVESMAEFITTKNVKIADKFAPVSNTNYNRQEKVNESSNDFESYPSYPYYPERKENVTSKSNSSAILSNNQNSVNEEVSNMGDNLHILISVCVSVICLTMIAVFAVIILIRRKKLNTNDSVEEMKTHFVYKKSIDLSVYNGNSNQ